MKINEAQNKRPDSSQTTVKTAYNPTKEKEPLQGSKSTEVKTASREGENFENQRIKSREAPNDKRDGSFPEGGGQSNQVVMVVLMEMGDQIKAENHPERGKNHQMGLEK